LASASEQVAQSTRELNQARNELKQSSNPATEEKYRKALEQ